MNTKWFLPAALAAAALLPGVASASLVLDTGTPPTTTPDVVLNTSQFFAAEFSLTAGETIDSLSAYLTQGAGQPGNTFTWDIYSASSTFLGANRAAPVFTTTGTFTANGFNTTSTNFTATATGDYWVALQVSSKTQTPGLDLPTESSTTSGTAPAIAFADAINNNRFALETADPVGIQVDATSAVPLPAGVWLLGSGLLALGSGVRRRNAKKMVGATA